MVGLEGMDKSFGRAEGSRDGDFGGWVDGEGMAG